MEPAITESKLDAIATRLALSTDERLAIVTIYTPMALTYRERATKVRALRISADKAFEQLAENAHELHEEWIHAWRALIVERRDAEKSLLADVRAIIPREAAETRWPGIERWLRREPLSIVQAPTVTRWHRLDLISCAEAARLLMSDASMDTAARVRPGTNAEQIADALDRYERDVDRPLAERAAMWDEEMHWPKEKQDRLAEELEGRNLDFGRRIADITRPAFLGIDSLLTPDEQLLWRATASKIVYQDIEQFPRPAGTNITRAITLEDLAVSQRENLDGLLKRYTRRSAELDADARASFDTADADALRFASLPSTERAKAINARTDPHSVVFLRAAAARKDFEEEASNELWSILDAGQRVRVESMK